MGISDEIYEGPERRQNVNAGLRTKLDEIGKKVTESPNLTEADMRLLYKKMRDYQPRGLESRSSDLLQIVREEHADELSSALLELMDDVLGRLR